MLLQIDLAHLLAGLGALVMVLGQLQGKGGAGKRRAVWSITGLSVMGFGAFMSCRWSQLLWESLPLLKYAQFPWRFLGLVVFGGAICATALIDRLAEAGPRSTIIASFVGIALVMATYFPLLFACPFPCR